MAHVISQTTQKVAAAILAVFQSPGALAFIPAICLGMFWTFDEAGLLATALALPILYSFGLTIGNSPPHNKLTYAHGGFHLRDTLIEALNTAIKGSASGKYTGCIMIEIDDFPLLSRKLGMNTSETLLQRSGDRLRSVLRDMDVIARLDGGVFAVALAPAYRLDIENILQLSTRLQTALEEPFSINAARHHFTVSIGIALSSSISSKSGDALLDAAELALFRAKSNGQGNIRTYSQDMMKQKMSNHALQDRAADALNTGQIRAWFQPQICTNTGKISGFEALARWAHAERGIIPPSEFLPALESAGLMERLGEVILTDTLSALREWDRQGLRIPTVGINFCTDELCNPKLVDKIKWELDRYNLTPNRLTIEILETVVSQSSNDIITRNIAGLSALGCAVDLDDFGTGHASISNIRRFAVSRIKIDRSFVSKIDKDPNQQKMVTAILTMAEQLELETLAEGVETVGEHTLLAQLGCGHIQGFGLARPMPFDKTHDWVLQHQGKIAHPPEIQKRISRK